jgi:hypothetical protein
VQNDSALMRKIAGDMQKNFAGRGRELRNSNAAARFGSVGIVLE